MARTTDATGPGLAGAVGSGKKQHVDLWRKLRLRQRLLAQAWPGAVYVPFIGDGDIAAELYAGRRIYGADRDPERVASAQRRLPGAVLEVADCDRWPFAGLLERFAVADFDAYGNPYLSLDAFWGQARKADRVVLFGTDGLRQMLKRKRAVTELPAGQALPAEGNQWRQWYNFWWPQHVRPWLTERLSPWEIIQESKYTRGSQLYWGLVVERRG